MPKAETENDLKNEAEIVGYIIAKYPKQYDGFMKIDHLGYRLDGVLTKRHEYGYAVPKLFYEAKDRVGRFAGYPDYIISHSKVEAAQAMTEATQMRCCLFVRFADGVIASVDFARFDGRCRFGGRQDRPFFIHDSEPLAIFDWKDFVILREAAP
jgi:hypothetical protein